MKKYPNLFISMGSFLIVLSFSACTHTLFGNETSPRQVEVNPLQIHTRQAPGADVFTSRKTLDEGIVRDVN